MGRGWLRSIFLIRRFILNIEDLIWNIATSAINPLIILLVLGVVFDYLNNLIFKGGVGR